jgi:hypothetical protein
MVLSGALAMAQAPSLENRQRTTGVVGITQGESARLNVLYPTAPAPILQPNCTVALNIADDQGKILKSSGLQPILPGKTLWLDLNADTDLTTAVRTQIHGSTISPACNLVTTLEIVDNATQRTVVVVGSEPTFPPVSAAPAAAARP